VLFHITTADAWSAARAIGVYVAPSLATEGFIHLSTEAQWPRTHERFFRDQTGLVLLAIDETLLGTDVRYEPADGELFPHLYGPLATRAVCDVSSLDGYEPD
jgi:uncharacterized protein (DUF952 family)